MLRITNAWTNRDRPYGEAAGYGYVFWLSCLEPNGRYWWVIAHIGGGGIGFTGVSIREVSDEDSVARTIASDEDDNESLSALEPSEAMAAISAEMAKTRGAVWSRDYVDHFALVSREFDMLSRAITESDAVRPYERFRDQI